MHLCIAIFQLNKKKMSLCTHKISSSNDHEYSPPHCALEIQRTGVDRLLHEPVKGRIVHPPQFSVEQSLGAFEATYVVSYVAEKYRDVKVYQFSSLRVCRFFSTKAFRVHCGQCFCSLFSVASKNESHNKVRTGRDNNCFVLNFFF